MKWRKKYMNMLIVNCWIVTILVFAVCYIFYQDGTIKEQSNSIDNLEVKVEAAQERCKELRTELSASKAQAQSAEKELERFVDRIEYGRDPAPIYGLPLSIELQQFTYDTCRYYGISEYYETVLAMMWKESTFDPKKISATNDYGLLQINACNHKYLKETLDLVDMLDEKDNIEGGVYLLSTLLTEYDNNIEKALMVYNMGPTSAAVQWSRGNYRSSYVSDVLAITETIKQFGYVYIGI